jgi:ectoine hydroxylase-related dioxygenase (phytanoyl-CoA dioxygenase family)
LHGFETDWRGQAPVPVLCSAGDGMLFRSEAWHSGSHNRTADRSRYLLQVHYGTRAVATRFATHLDFRHNPAVLAAANPRQQRLLGDHQPTAYG